jgi:hypothetical protein
MSEQNKAIIRRVREEVLSQGRLDLLDGLYADNYMYHGIPLFGEFRGPHAFKDMVVPFLGAVSEFRERVEDQIAEGDKVVTRVTGSGKHTGDLMGAAPTGRQLQWTRTVISGASPTIQLYRIAVHTL